MKVYRIIKWCFLLNLFLGQIANAQTIRPDEPSLTSVSVDPVTGYVTITWGPNENPDPSALSTDGYELYWHVGGSNPTNHKFATITNSSVFSYTFDMDTVLLRLPNMPDPRTTSVPFTVAAYHNAPRELSLLTLAHHNIQVTSQYDSCREEIKLNWYPYIGWYENRPPFRPLLSYRVMRIPQGGGPHEEIKLLSDQDTSYTVPRVKENEQYIYYIEAARHGGTIVTSYYTERYTQMPIPPDTIIAVGTQYNAQGLAEISFKLDPLSQTHSYEFLGSSRPDLSFVSLGSLNIYSDTTLTDIQTREKTYYYKLAAWHVCKNKHTTVSNVATALWLYLKQEDQINALQWDAYTTWGSPAQYEIHRRIGTNPDEVIATLTDSDAMSYRDDVSGTQFEGEICYWIEARPASGGSAGQQAISNSICILPESDIFIPQAFTPNNDGRNDKYYPSFSYPPQEYLMIVYDRNGAKIFQTEDIAGSWDGLLKNGKPASEGVYVYYIRFRTAKGRLVEKRGTFSLVLP